jgi:ABC-type Mn2+/Zn2+ transport system permease subunit
LLLCFDADLVSAMGYRATWYHRLMLLLIAATVVVSFQTVGALLVFGMLLAPAGVGALISKRIGTMMLWAALVGIVSTYVGLLASYHFSWAAGASVVLTAVTIFFVVFTGVSMKHSIVGDRS